MVGLVPVKNKVTEMVARMKFEQETRKKKYDKEKRQYGTNGRHYVFMVLRVQEKLPLPESLQVFSTNTVISKKISALRLTATFSKQEI